MRGALRGIRRKPFGLLASSVAVVIGVGLNLAVCTLLYSAFWQPLPYRDAQELVVPVVVDNTQGQRSFLTDSELLRLRELPSLFAEVASIERWPASRRAWLDVQHDGQVRRVPGGFITPNFFDLIGIYPTIGRPLTFADAQSQEPVVVISYELWIKLFNSRSDLSGAALRINGIASTVVGVMPKDFVAPVQQLTGVSGELDDLGILMMQRPSQITGIEGRAMQYTVIGRLRRDQTPGTATAYLNESDGTRPASGRFLLLPLRQAMLGQRAGTYVLLAGLSFLLLAIALSTVAAVVLLRQADSIEELSVKIALGARGWLLWSTPVLETVMLGAGAGAAASFGFIGARKLLVHLLPPVPWGVVSLPILALAGVTMAFVILVTAVGALTARQVGRQLTKESGVSLLAGRAGGSARDRAQRIILAIDIGIMIAISVPASALWSGVAAFRHENVHLVRSDVIAADMWIVDRVATDESHVIDSEDRLLAHAKNIPGVINVGASSETPLLGPAIPTFNVGLPKGAVGGREMRSFGYHVDRGFFEVMRVRLLQGRLLGSQDTKAAPPVAVVSMTFAQRAFGRPDVVGEHISFHGRREIVGVTEDVNWWTNQDRVTPMMYVPWQQDPSVRFCLLVQIGSAAELSAVAPRIAALDADQPMDRVAPLESVVDLAFSSQRLYVAGAAVIALSSFLIGLMGVYLVVDYAIRTRQRDIGIRLALGATRRRVCVDCVRRFGTFVIPGALASIPLALWTLSWIRSVLTPIALPGNVLVLAAAAVLITIALSVVALSAWRHAGPSATIGLRVQT